MPSVEWNKQKWDGAYGWEADGDEWSNAWGGPAAQWEHVLLPRVAAFVPAGTILEIAPGRGRWTQFLAGLADELILVDLSASCIEFCRQRFVSATHLRYHVNDGRSLAMIDDASIDFAFSFDSLVHVEADVIESYLGQLRHKLKPDGVAFIHHSNIGAYKRHYWFRDIDVVRRWLRSLGVEVRTNGRAFSMTAERFDELARAAGFACLSQERVNWHATRMIDCFSVITPMGSRWEAPKRLRDHPMFMREAEGIRELTAREAGGAPAATSRGPGVFDYVRTR